MKILLTADIHLRGDAPACRQYPDKWLEDQDKSFMQLPAIASRRHCDEVWIIGDLFHRARTSTEATVQALGLMHAFDVPVRVLVGNHDAYQHAYENLHKSTIGAIYSLAGVHELVTHTIRENGRHIEVRAYPFGTEPEQIPSCDIWCVHTLTFPDEASRPLPELGVLAEELLERSDAKVIITGDYHHGYVKEFGDRKVITCGCLNIQARDMADYQPRCYILDTKDFSVEEVPLETFGELDLEAPILEDADGYAETLQMTQLPKIDFRAAVEQAAQAAEKTVRNKVENALEAYDESKIV